MGGRTRGPAYRGLAAGHVMSDTPTDFAHVLTGSYYVAPSSDALGTFAAEPTN